MIDALFITKRIGKYAYRGGGGGRGGKENAYILRNKRIIPQHRQLGECGKGLEISGGIKELVGSYKKSKKKG